MLTSVVSVGFGCVQNPNPSDVSKTVVDALRNDNVLEAVLTLPAPKFDLVRFREADGYWINYRVLERSENKSLIYWWNETVPSLGWGHMVYVGDKIIATDSRVRGARRETENRISEFRFIPSDYTNVTIDGVSSNDLSFAFKANQALPGWSNLTRSYHQRVTGETTVTLNVNGEWVRSRGFLVTGQNSYDLYAVGHSPFRFVYVPGLGTRVDEEKESGQLVTASFSFQVSNEVLARLKNQSATDEIPSSGVSAATAEALGRLRRLLDQKLITVEEHNAKRDELLSRPR